MITVSGEGIKIKLWPGITSHREEGGNLTTEADYDHYTQSLIFGRSMLHEVKRTLHTIS